MSKRNLLAWSLVCCITVGLLAVGIADEEECQTRACCLSDYFEYAGACIGGAPRMPPPLGPNPSESEQAVFNQKLAERKLYLENCFDAVYDAYSDCLGSLPPPEQPKPTSSLNNGHLLSTMEPPTSSGTTYSFSIALPENQRGAWTLNILNGLSENVPDPSHLMRVSGSVKVNGITVISDGVLNESFSNGGFSINLNEPVNSITLKIRQSDDSEFGFLYAFVEQN